MSVSISWSASPLPLSPRCRRGGWGRDIGGAVGRRHVGNDERDAESVREVGGHGDRDSTLSGAVYATKHRAAALTFESRVCDAALSRAASPNLREALDEAAVERGGTSGEHDASTAVIDLDDLLHRDLEPATSEPALSDEQHCGAAVLVSLASIEDSDCPVRGFDEVIDHLVEGVRMSYRQAQNTHLRTVAGVRAAVDRCDCVFRG